MLKAASLPESVLAIIQNRETERPYSGDYDKFTENGTFLCRQCGLALFHSSAKFHSGCGWPSFDNTLPGAVKQYTDADGQRIEIVCARCNGHLGHVFKGEGYTESNTRHCVNSLSLDFISATNVKDTEEAIYAAGCFWGVEYLLTQLPGVLKTQVGYSGGATTSPTYHDVCNGGTGHYEVVRVIYDPNVISYEALTKFFFEIHNFKQQDGQGPDIGQQYKSAVFYYNDEQENIAVSLVKILEELGHQVSTSILPVSVFWPAEQDHQEYYEKHGEQPYCHRHQNIFP